MHCIDSRLDCYNFRQLLFKIFRGSSQVFLSFVYLSLFQAVLVAIHHLIIANQYFLIAPSSVLPLEGS